MPVYKKKTSAAPKYKRKSGYALKKGVSGELRWHRVAGGDDAPPPRSLLAKTDQGKSRQTLPTRVLSNTPDAVEHRLRRGRFQPSVRLNDLADEAKLIVDSQKEEAQKITDMYVGINGTPDLKRALSDLGWSAENTFATGGVGSQGGIGFRSSLLEYHNKLEKVKANSDPLHRFIASFSNPDTSLTPDLKRVDDLLREHEISNSSAYRAYKRDLSGGGMIKVIPTSNREVDSIIGSRVLDHLDFMDLLRTSDTYQAITKKGGGNLKTEDVTTLQLLADRTLNTTSLRDVSGRATEGGEQKMIRYMAKALENSGFQLHMSSNKYHFDAKSAELFAKRSEYIKDTKRAGRKLRQLALTDPDLAKALETLTGRVMNGRRGQALEEAATARLFASVVGGHFVDSMKIEEDTNSKRKPASGQMTPQKVIQNLKSNINTNLATVITNKDEDFLQIMGNDPDAATSTSSKFHLPAFFNHYDGMTFISRDMGGVGDRASERMLPGRSSVALHEAIHSLDAFIHGVSTAVEMNELTPVSERRDINSEKFLPGSGIMQKMADHGFLMQERLTIVGKNVTKSALRARSQLSRDLGTIAGSMLMRNSAEQDMFEQYSFMSSKPKNRILSVPSMVDNYPSPLFFLPEFNRMAYALAANRDERGFDEQPSVENDFNISKRKPFSAITNPEIITVLTEYAVGAPHVLEAMDEMYGTRIRENVNRYYNASVVQKSDPVLLANARVNLAAAIENPDSLYRGYIDKTIHDVRKYDMTPYHAKVIPPKHMPDYVNLQ
jgi:hypothetical protein